MVRIALALLLTGTATLAGWSEPLAAQSLVGVQHTSTTRGLMAQADLARVRERRLADDREVALLTGYEARIGGLQRQLGDWQRRASLAQGLSVQEKQARRRAEAELATTRTELATLAEAAARRDAEWAAEREAYRSEMQSMVAIATPEKLAALERFADGDRVGAWPVLREITEASVRARMAAAGARAGVEMRQLAEQRSIMRANGEATAADALAIWEAAAGLDPKNFATWFETSTLKRELHDLGGSRRAALAARDSASSDRERAIATDILAKVAIAAGDYAEAERSYTFAIGLLRQIVAQDPADSGALRDLCVGLVGIGDARQFLGQIQAGLKNYEECLPMARAQAAAEPDDIKRVRELAAVVQRIGMVQTQLGKLEAANRYAAEELALTRRILAANPANRDDRYGMASTLTQAAGLRFREENYAGAVQLLDEAVGIHRALVAEDPTSTASRIILATALDLFSGALRADGRRPAALPAIDESIAIIRAIAASGPPDSAMQSKLASALETKARLIKELGDPAAGIALSQEALAIRTATAALAGNSIHLQRGLRLRHQVLGDDQLSFGDFAGAVQTYATAAALGSEILGSADKVDDDAFQQAYSLLQLGTARMGRQDWGAALASFAESGALYRTLSAAEPERLDIQRDLAVTVLKSGEVAFGQGDYRAALTAFRQGLAMRQAVANKHPGDLRAQEDLIIIRFQISDTLRKLEEKPAELAEYRAALPLAAALVAADPANPGYAAYVTELNSRIAALQQPTEAPAP